jgi:hypothetical protein
MKRRCKRQSAIDVAVIKREPVLLPTDDRSGLEWATDLLRAVGHIAAKGPRRYRVGLFADLTCDQSYPAEHRRPLKSMVALEIAAEVQDSDSSVRTHSRCNCS